MNDGSYRPKVTYLSKKTITCPVCGEKFCHESLMSGGGRLIAGDVTDTLHRTYKPSATYGKIYPLAYNIVVCPSCLYASMPGDFISVDESNIGTLNNQTFDRVDFANKFCGHPVDFSKARTLETGAISFALAIECYDYFDKRNIPVIKQAICSMRAAFLCEELDKEFPNQYYDFLVKQFYKKALFFYERAQYLNQEREQIMENMKNLGPDTDKDYGYDGVMYLIGVLLFRYGNDSDPVMRMKDLEKCKMYFGKLFGMGKANVNKPKEILDKSKEFYTEISKIIKEAEGTTDEENAEGGEDSVEQDVATFD